jgi:hypothetical protein
VDDRAWLSFPDPEAVLCRIGDGVELSERKARLLSAALCRRIWHLLPDEASRQVVGVAERYADGHASLDEMGAAARAAAPAARRGNPAAQAAVCCAIVADDEAYDFAHVPAYAAGQVRAAATEAATSLASSYGEAVTIRSAERAAQTATLDCVFGGPSNSPSLELPLPGTAVRLAQAAYEERDLANGHLDRHLLAVLAAALEEAGADAGLVDHLRGPGPHWRGCHVLDLVLGKG